MAPAFKAAVTDISTASTWYSKHFGMIEVEPTTPATVILERDGIRLGFSQNGGDASQDGAAILVVDIHELKRECENNGLSLGDTKTEVRDDGISYIVFFVVAPDGLCFYFHEPQTEG